MTREQSAGGSPKRSSGRPTQAGIAQDPVAFVREVLREDPYDKQEEILNAMVTAHRVSVVGCNGSGKDWAAARAVLWWMHSRSPAKAIVTGPTNRQVDQDGWGAYERGDYQTALREWRPLATQGNAPAQFNLGLMYDHGYGVPQDDAEAVKWYRLAAEQGDARGRTISLPFTKHIRERILLIQSGLGYGEKVISKSLLSNIQMCRRTSQN